VLVNLNSGQVTVLNGKLDFRERTREKTQSIFLVTQVRILILCLISKVTHLSLL